MNTSVGTRVPLTIGVGIVLLCVAACFAWRSTEALLNTSAWVSHTHDVITQLGALEESIVSADSAWRSFAFTGTDSDMDDFHDAEAAIHRLEGVLGQLTRDNPRQQHNLQVLQPLIDQKTRTMERGMANRERGADAARDMLRSQGGQSLMQAVHARIGAMRADEDRLLSERVDATNRSARMSVLFIALSTLIGVVFGGVAFLGIERDLRARQALLTRLEHLGRQHTLLLESADDGIYAVDPGGLITMANPAAAQMLGFAVDEMLGQDSHALFHHSHADGTPYPREACGLAHALAAGETVHGKNEVFWRKQGSALAVECSNAPLMVGGRVIGAVVTFHDVTEQRELGRMKDEFISMVSHELRTPLTSIRGSLGLLASGALGRLETKGQHMLDIAVTNTDRLVRLINDILDLERIESGTVTFKPVSCDSRSLVTKSIENLRGLADKTDIRLIPEVEAVDVMADEDRIVQTLTNFIGNAIKFSPPQGRVLISARPHGSDVRFEVRDEGPGIPPDKQQLVFERFRQVNASDARDKGGSGLGLAICRSIVIQHGGRIGLESTLGEGSCFYFTLPRASVVGGPTVRPPTGHPLVILCDLDRDMAARVMPVLSQRGMTLRTVLPGDNAFEHVMNEKPAAILINLALTRLDGWDANFAFKDLPASAARPIVYFGSPDPIEGPSTARTDEQEIFNALSRALPHATSERPRVLIVEDDADLAHVLAEAFARHGVDTLTAKTEREAIEVSRGFRPHLLVLDLILAEGDGFQVASWIRRDETLRNVRLFVYTAKDLTENEVAQLRRGDAEIFLKSHVSPLEFEQRVVDLLGQMIPQDAEPLGIG